MKRKSYGCVFDGFETSERQASLDVQTLRTNLMIF